MINPRDPELIKAWQSVCLAAENLHQNAYGSEGAIRFEGSRLGDALHQLADILWPVR